MNKMTRAAVTLLSAASLIPVGVLASTTASASVSTAAVTCGPFTTISTSGGYARYRECYDGGNVRVNGSVKDTDADGQCARVYASYNTYTGVDYSSKACPEGTTVNFTFKWRAGTDAYVYLQEI